MPRPRSARGVAATLAAALAALGHLGVGVFYLASGLVAPLWAVLLLWLVWLGLAVALIALWRIGSLVALAVPVVAVVVWHAVILAGQALLGWSA